MIGYNVTNDGVAEITLDRPDKLNAMTDEMWQQLSSALTSIGSEQAVTVVVLRGAGENFCAGSDVSTLVSDAPLDERMRLSNSCVLAVRDLPVPTIAVVDGVAAGAGANLALACDLVVLSTRARLSQLFIRRDLSLDSGASWLLPRLVGEHRARELAYFGDALDATTALQWGLANRVTEPAQLDQVAHALARRLAAANPQALAASKRLLNAAWSRTLSTALEAEIGEQTHVIASDRARKRIAAFTQGLNTDSTPRSHS